MERDRLNNLIIKAQRRLKEITLDFGTQFAGYYRRKIDSLCQEILNSLDRNDENAVTRTEAELGNVLYELNREVRLQYEDEDNFSMINPNDFNS